MRIVLPGRAAPAAIYWARGPVAAVSNVPETVLVKLAKLTKQKVSISSKEPGKPRVTMEIEYGLAEGSNLGSTKEYAGRAFQEAIGANIALNAAVDALPKKK